MPFDQVENDHPLILHLPYRGLVIDIRANIDLHVQLLVKERRGATHDGEAVGGDGHLDLAGGGALGHFDLDEHHPERLPPVPLLRDAAKPLFQELGLVDVRPEGRKRHDARRLPSGFDTLAEDVGHLHRAYLVGDIVARLVIGQRHLVGVDPKRVARRRDALAIDVLVQVPVADHSVVASPGEPRTPFDLAVRPAAPADRVPRLRQLLRILQLLPLLLVELLAAREQLAVRKLSVG
mmetsp:Transcript_26273/g.52710  ORF Transcript_26273/g.52710 Transcript_26273/m.52710 type:complete len:236 (-) Transcript_26273:297-1004(-)